MKPKKNSKNASGETCTDSLQEIGDGPLKDKIRKRAYELYLERRDERGSELQDWLRAEAEVVWKLSQ